MCNEPQSSWAAGVPTADNRLTGLLTPDVPPLPKVSIPLALPNKLKARHAALNAVSDVPHEENETLHVTADSAYLTSNTALTGSHSTEPAIVSVIGPSSLLSIEISPKQSATGAPQGGLADILNLALTFIPLLLTTEETPDPPPSPLLTYEVAVTGSSATIAGYKHDPTQAYALAGSGLNVFCIARAGGASILSTITACLPQLANGWEPFKKALLSALGPGGVDLVERIAECF